MPPEDLDLDDEGKKSGPKKMILLILLVILMVAGSVVGTMYFTGAFEEKKDKDAEEEKVAEIAEAFYLSLGKEFIVNFSGEQPADYMQIEITLMSRHQHYITVATANLPRIRHEILILLSGQKYSELRTDPGKEKLRKEIVEKIRTIVVSTNPSAPSIETIYFTHFIMQ